jgi:DNA (cytosine-5)-methyltransferase 1
MKVLSLFSGIGGFDLAFERAGMVSDSMVEIDKNAQNILRRHFPNSKLYNDVKEVGNATHQRGSIEIVCGGFPCQDLSIAGKRAGLAGERSGLWFEFARIIDELEPRWVVAENVPGLLSSDKGRDFAIIIRWLAERGYGVSWRVLDAQYFGVPQRRRRVFIVGSLGNGRSAEVLFEREGMFGDLEKGREEGKRVAETIAGGSNKCHSDITSGQQDKNVVPVYAIRRAQTGSNGWGIDTIAHTLDETGGDAVSVTFDGRNLNLHNQSPTLQSKKSGGYSLNYTPMIVEQNNMASTPDMISLRSNPAQPGIVATSWTLRGGKEGGGKGYLGSVDQAMTLGGQPQWVGVRRLTPTECERLQGFPDGWTEGQSDSTRYRQLGNAVAVPVVEWIGRRIVEIQKEQ